MKNSSVTQATAWRVRCYDTKGRLHSDVTRYEPVPAYELLNLEHHFRVVITEMVDSAKLTALQVLLDKASCMLSEGALSEDGLDGEDAMELVEAISDQLEYAGVTSTERAYFKLYQDICKAAGVNDDDEVSPTDALAIALKKAASTEAPDSDLIDIVRSLVCFADRMEGMSPVGREHYPSPLSPFSPLVIAARQACRDRGFTDGGLSVDIDRTAHTASFIATQADSAGEA